MQHLDDFLFFQQVLAYLETTDFNQLECVNLSIFTFLKNDHLWKMLCVEVYDSELPKVWKLPHGASLRNQIKTYEGWSWRDSFKALEYDQRQGVLSIQCLSKMKIPLSWNTPSHFVIDRTAKSKVGHFLNGKGNHALLDLRLNQLMETKPLDLEGFSSSSFDDFVAAPCHDHLCVIQCDDLGIHLFHGDVAIPVTQLEGESPPLPLFNFSLDLVDSFFNDGCQVYRFILFGGDNGAENQDDYVVYDHVYSLKAVISDSTTKLSWIHEDVKGERPCARSCHTSVFSRETLFIFGGSSDSNHENLFNELHLFHIKTLIFSKEVGPRELSPRYSAGMDIFHHLLILFGGVNSSLWQRGKSLSHHVHLFDLLRRQWIQPWTEGIPICSKETRTALAVIENDLFAIHIDARQVLHLRLDKNYI